MTQSELVARIRAGRQVLLAVLARVPPAERETPGAMGEWSVKDTIVHLNYWGGQLVTLLYQVRSGQTPATLSVAPDLDVEAVNRRWHAQGKNRPWEAAWSDFNGIHAQVIRRVKEFSDAELNSTTIEPKLRGRPLWSWVAADTYDHDEEHARAILAWLEAKGL